jgi:hypothetical protein
MFLLRGLQEVLRAVIVGSDDLVEGDVPLAVVPAGETDGRLPG